MPSYASMPACCYMLLLQVLTDAVNLLVDLSTVVVTSLTTAGHLNRQVRNGREIWTESAISCTKSGSVWYHLSMVSSRTLQEQYPHPIPYNHRFFPIAIPPLPRIPFFYSPISINYNYYNPPSFTNSLAGPIFNGWFSGPGRTHGRDARSQCRRLFEGHGESCASNGWHPSGSPRRWNPCLGNAHCSCSHMELYTYNWTYI